MKAIGRKEYESHIGEKVKIIAYGGMHFWGTIVSPDSVQLAPGGFYGGAKLSSREATVYVATK